MDGTDDTNITDDRFRRKRPIPIPIYDSDRYIERPYLKKHELAKIRDNLDELVEIKTGLFDKPVIDKPAVVKPVEIEKPKIVMPEPKKEDIKNDFFTSTSGTSNTNILDTKVPSTIISFDKSDSSFPIIDPKVKSEPKSEIKPEVKPEFVSEIKKDEIKFGIGNLENKQQTQQPQQINDNKPKSKIVKRKVIKRMNDEEVIQYNVSPEERRRRLRTDIQEVHEENVTKEAIRRSAELAEQNKRELEQNRLKLEKLEQKLAEENDRIKADLKTEFGNKIGELGGKFNELGGRFSNIDERFNKVSGKLEETCTGIECLKKDLANMNKNFDLTECPDCGEKIVPPLASYCPGCSAKIKGWTEDDGITPIKGWKPNWKKDE